MGLSTPIKVIPPGIVKGRMLAWLRDRGDPKTNLQTLETLEKQICLSDPS